MSPLPPEVIKFASSHIRSTESLATFVLCVDHHDRWWDATSVARRVLISEGAATRALDDLARANLLDIRISDAVRYRFHPGTEDLATRAAAFASTYHERPMEIVKLVARFGVPDSVRDFADAFRIKRDDKG
jgi:hypothetical protein